MKSEVFNWNRFWRYFKSDFNSFISRYGITLLVLSTMAVTTDAFNGLFSSILTGSWIGITAPVRYILFIIFGVIIMLTAPAKLYGHLTDRKEGSAFIMLPASKLEKYISMVVITCIITPFIFGLIYLGLDIMVCMFDHTCGTSMFSQLFFTDFKSLLASTISQAEINDWGFMMDSITSAFTPFIYFDDIMQTMLYFLLGALIFKTSKTGKTLGCLILLGLTLEMLLSPIMALTFFQNFKVLADSNFNGFTADTFNQTFPFISWMIRHLVLIDTLWDGLLNCLLLFLIWLRFSRMKH